MQNYRKLGRGSREGVLTIAGQYWLLAQTWNRCAGVLSLWKNQVFNFEWAAKYFHPLWQLWVGIPRCKYNLHVTVNWYFLNIFRHQNTHRVICSSVRAWCTQRVNTFFTCKLSWGVLQAKISTLELAIPPNIVVRCGQSPPTLVAFPRSTGSHTNQAKRCSAKLCRTQPSTKSTWRCSRANDCTNDCTIAFSTVLDRSKQDCTGHSVQGWIASNCKTFLVPFLTVLTYVGSIYNSIRTKIAKITQIKAAPNEVTYLIIQSVLFFLHATYIIII